MWLVYNKGKKGEKQQKQYRRNQQAQNISCKTILIEVDVIYILWIWKKKSTKKINKKVKTNSIYIIMIQ